MIHQDIKGLAKECDEVIAKFISFNIPISDTQDEHSLAVFMLVRKGYTLMAQTCTKAFKGATIRLDDAFHMDELLQDLHSECLNEIMKSERYEPKEQ